jgi:uncharacterized protein YndB with AHSA1/START domain
MAEHTWAAERDLPAPIEVAWATLTDFASYPAWNPFTTEVETTLTPGSPIRMRVNLGWAHVWQTETVRAVDPPHHVAWALDHLPAWLLRARRDQRLTALPDGTCRYRTEDTIGGALLPFVRLLYGRGLTDGFAAMADALATECARRVTSQAAVHTPIAPDAAR